MALLRTPGMAGVDEAGRGPLAGPVAVAAVILPKGVRLPGLDDSKRVAAADRERLAEVIRRETTWALTWAEPDEIETRNILWATLAAMERAIDQLSEPPTAILVDGNRVPPGLVGRARAVVGGDAKLACIAAASILAKVARDQRMREYAEMYPGYGFERHFGYPTPDHMAALRELGPCPIHRPGFGPVPPRQAQLVLPGV